MELRHLRYFIAIAEEQSFTAAAERLWVAQPGLSAQIRRLEAELDLKLFDRHTRGVDLTQAGERFLERARVAVAAADAAAATGRDLEAGVIGSVRLGIASDARTHRTADLLQKFATERPQVELTVVEAPGGLLWRELRERRLDTVVAPSGHASPDLATLDFASEAWVVLMGTGHPLAGIGPVAAHELDGCRIAVTRHRDGTAFDRAIANLVAELGVAPEFVPSAPGPAFHAAVAQNDLVALTTAPGALGAGVIARRLAPHRVLSFELLSRHHASSPAVDALIGMARGDAVPGSRTLKAVA